jgi:hypothetical protein
MTMSPSASWRTDGQLVRVHLTLPTWIRMSPATCAAPVAAGNQGAGIGEAGALHGKLPPTVSVILPPLPPPLVFSARIALPACIVHRHQR